jgi:quercetin dioxygenase-like cupin family protein
MVLPFHGHAQTATASAGQAAPAGRNGRAGGANRLLDNERVSVQRLTAAAGLTETMHKSPMDIVAIQATPGQIEMWIGNDKDKIEKTTGAQGKVWYLPKSEDHALFNRGSADVDMIVVNLK